MRTLVPFLACLLPMSAIAQDGAVPAKGADHKIEVLLITGANNHDWEYTHEVHARTLTSTGRFNVTVTLDPAATLSDADALAKYDVFFLDYNSNHRWGEPAEKNFLSAVRNGTGVSVIHAANNAFPGWVEYEKLVGHCWRRGTGHGRFHEFDVEIVDRKHPITLGMPMLVAQPDELYHRLVHMHGVKFRLLMQAMSAKDTGGTGNYEPMVMVKHYGKGRVFHTPLGHVWRNQENTRRSVNTAQFKLLISRGTEWAATGRVTIQPATFGLKPPAPNQLTMDEKKGGWELLFDGKSTDHWRGYRQKSFPATGWAVEDGSLVKVKGQPGGDIITKQMYGNFEFQCEWKVEKGGNSGIMYLCTEQSRTPWMTGPEMQILDNARHPDGRNPKTRAGTLYGIFACKDPIYHPAGEWNHALIHVEYPKVEHWLNGTKVVEYNLDDEGFRKLVAKSKFARWPEFATAKKGHIALQDHGNLVAFRNIKIRPLADDR